jgi:endoglucanase
MDDTRPTTRRDFLRRLGAGAVLAAAGWATDRSSSEAAPHPLPPLASEGATPARPAMRPWRGFNLLEKFRAERQGPFVERDFEWMARWKLDFVRLPMDYRSWTDSKDPARVDDKVLADIDQAIEWGKGYGIHVNLNLHRAPGYCVNPPAEPLDLWTSNPAQEQFAGQWRRFAERYRGIPSARLSFNLLNEPTDMEESVYVRVMKLAIEAIRAADPMRLIVVDGLRWGRDPVPSLVETGVAQSTRGYDPMEISHYGASWVGRSDRWPEPTWPLGSDDRDGSRKDGKDGGRKNRWDRERYRAERIRPWKELEGRGVGVHVGEWGCFNRTPHAVALAWMRDLLALWREAGWGWALWNLRGSFGVVDSGRRDVAYERFDEHDLDRAMLALLLEDGELRQRSAGS